MVRSNRMDYIKQDFKIGDLVYNGAHLCVIVNTKSSRDGYHHQFIYRMYCFKNKKYFLSFGKYLISLKDEHKKDPTRFHTLLEKR